MPKSWLIPQLSLVTLAAFAVVTGMSCYYALIQAVPTTTTVGVTTEPPMLFGAPFGGGSTSLFTVHGCVDEYNGNLEDTVDMIQQATRPTTEGDACIPGNPLVFSFERVSPDTFSRSSLNFPLNTFHVDYEYNATVPSLDRFSGDLDDELGITVLTQPPWGYLILPQGTLVNSSCFVGYGYSQAMLDFDEERREMVAFVVSPDTTTICVERASNATNYTSFAWAGYYTAMAQTTGLAFDTYVWGDYYIMNWPLSNISLIVDKRAPLVHYGFVNTQFNAYSLEQGNSGRGPLISTYAPCGIFMSLDQVNQVIRVELCGAAFAITETLTWNLTGISGGLTDDASCQCVQNNTNITDHSDEVRASYMSFVNGAEDRIALAVTSSLSTKRIFWTQVHQPNTSQALSMNLLDEQASAWAPSMSYECRSNLAMTYYALDPVSGQVATKITYRARTDPPNTMREPLTFSLVPLQPLQPSFLQPFDQLAFLSVHPISSEEVAVNYLRIANETLYYQWTVSDSCGYFQACPVTTIHLGNVDQTCF